MAPALHAADFSTCPVVWRHDSERRAVRQDVYREGHDMQFTTLGKSDLRVSRVCLGTMTWGTQNSQDEAHAQLDYAVAQGVNFIDTAEMYAVPPSPESYGKTEAIIGHWLRRQARDSLVIASKAAGPGRPLTWINGGQTHFTLPNLRAAVTGSLARLQTDYIDLYQLHWPDRSVPTFGQYHFDPQAERDTTPIRETLDALATLVREGKIRYVGLSNETAWGVMQFTRLADDAGLPRVVSVQNAYSLLNRRWESDLAEVCFREGVSLLPYSVLGFGVLSGKYIDNPQAEGRFTRYPGFAQRYQKPNVAPAVGEYAALARELGMTPAQMAHAFVAAQWFVGSTIVGATSQAQLAENIAACAMPLPADALARIESIFLRYPNPAP